jgi:hypothetical protein
MVVGLPNIAEATALFRCRHRLDINGGGTSKYCRGCGAVSVQAPTRHKWWWDFQILQRLRRCFGAGTDLNIILVPISQLNAISTTIFLWVSSSSIFCEGNSIVFEASTFFIQHTKNHSKNKAPQ